METVSIVTPSTYGRREFLLILKEIIENQTYKNILEWVIVDGSETEVQDKFRDFIQTLSLKNTKINYYDTKTHSGKRTIGFLRNKTNEVAKGDIIVCMDDDDYYIPDKVRTMVNALKSSKCLIAGTDDVFIYEPTLDMIIQHTSFGANHGTNNTFAYKREYLQNHKYDESVSFGEESSFTNKYSEPMVQVPPLKGVLVMSHSTNTYSKKKIIFTDVILGKNSNIPLKKFIKEKPIFTKFQTLFSNLYPTKTSKYDICYLCGLGSGPWSPKQKNLGGSEKAIVHLTRNWVKLGKRVVVFGNFDQIYSEDGVDYLPSEHIQHKETYPIVILWRAMGLYQQHRLPIKYNKIFLDLHDNPVHAMNDIKQIQFKLDGIFVKSKFHLQLFKQHLKEHTLDTKYFVIPNGVEIDIFKTNYYAAERNPYRLCYTSWYSRGLEPILKYFFPKLRELEPRAELHIYYGMDLIKDEKFKENMNKLLQQPNVYEYGKQDIEVINYEKHKSTFHMYYTSSLEEIDCIAIKESLVAGCIPLISNDNVFKERDGLHFDQPTDKVQSYLELAMSVAKLMNDLPKQEQIREKFMKSPTLMEWDVIAKGWLDILNKV